MKPILYIETNFVIGIAKGQDPEGKRLIKPGFDDIQLAMPGVCFMEALSVLVFEEKQRKRFHQELDRHRGEFRRNTLSVKASELVEHLDRSRISGDELLNEFQVWVVLTLLMLSINAEIIQIDPIAIKDALVWRRTVIDDPTDALILSCIVSHAQKFLDIPKAFVSHNSNDFGQKAAIEKLDEVGIKYFKDVQKAVGWLRAQNPLQPDST